MTLNTFSSGINTNFSNELNENFQQSIIRRSKGSEDTNEYSVLVTGGYVDTGYSKTFTVPNGISILPIALNLKLDSRTDISEGYYVRAKLVNNDTSQELYVYKDVTGYSDSTVTNPRKILFSGSGTSYGTREVISGLWDTESYSEVGESDDRESISVVNPSFWGIKEGTSYTLTIEVSNQAYNDPNFTFFIKNITPTLYWQYIGEESIEGWS